jgi:uroporphyrin-III C-methyltransferase/precorrin-2 dehydrogenase/sirohydrochlorin ferrochelatase
MKFLPIFLAIAGKKCLVVGAGSIAARKAELLHKAGAKLCVVAPDIGVALRDLAFAEEIELSQRAFVESDLDDAV